MLSTDLTLYSLNGHRDGVRSCLSDAQSTGTASPVGALSGTCTFTLIEAHEALIRAPQEAFLPQNQFPFFHVCGVVSDS